MWKTGHACQKVVNVFWKVLFYKLGLGLPFLFHYRRHLYYLRLFVLCNLLRLCLFVGTIAANLFLVTKLFFLNFLRSLYFCVRHYCYVVYIILSSFFTCPGGSYSVCLCIAICIAMFNSDFQSLHLCSRSYFWSLPSGVCLRVQTALFPQLITCISKC